MSEQRITLNVNTTGDESEAGINSSTSTFNLDSLAELADLLKRAGITGAVMPSPNDDQSMDTDIGQDEVISLEPEVDENADYDYGINPTSRKGYVYNVDPYAYLGSDELDTRNVPARMADNPLKRVNSKTFEDYLYEVEYKISKKK